MNYLQSDQSNEEQAADMVYGTNASLSTICSVFWTFVNISKSNSTYETRIKLLGKELAMKNPMITPYFFLTMDKSDWNSMGIQNIPQFIKNFQAFYQSNTFSQNQFFKDSPEGFGRLLLAIYYGKYEDLIRICGEHRIDPSVVLDIIFEVFDSNPTNEIFNLIKQFPTVRVYQFLLHRMKTHFTAGISRIVGHFYENEIFSDKFLLSLFTNQKESFYGLYDYYQKAAKNFAIELQKPLTTLPGESKENFYKPSFIEARKRFNEAKDVIDSFPLFLMLKKLDGDEFIHALKVLSAFDPCQIQEICEKVKNIVIESFKSGNPNFELLVYLGGHICDPEFINMVLDVENLPASIFSYFILPAMAMSDVPWQISIRIFDILKSRFTFSQRREIYNRFDSFQSRSVDQMLIVANTKRKVVFALKRVSKNTATKFAPKFSRLILRAPSNTATALLEFIGDKVPYDNESVINLVSCLSSLSFDMLLDTFLKNIDAKNIFSAGKNISEWPEDVATFLSNVFTENYNEMDLAAYVNILYSGIASFSTAHVCLFAILVERMCGVEYRGNLTKAQYNERYADNYLVTKRRVIADDVSTSESFTTRSKHMKDTLHNDNIGIRIIAALDLMRHVLPSMSATESLSDRLDHIQFAIIESCEPMDLTTMKIAPNEIMDAYGLSLECAFHLVRASCSEECARQLSPSIIPSDLFEMFWRLQPNDFHVPVKFVQSIVENWTEKAQHVTDKAVIELNIEVLKTARERQIKRAKETEKKIIERGVNWFKTEEDYWNFVKICVIPRTIFSEYDAVYCAFFINSLFHNVAHIDIMAMINALLRNFHFIVYSSTLEEAHSCAIFITKLMKSIKNLEEKEKMAELLMQKIMILLNRMEVNCLMNAIEVCSILVDHFPDSDEHFDMLFAAIENIRSEFGPPPENLNLKCNSYEGKLKKRKRQRKEKMQADEEKKKAAMTELQREEQRILREKQEREAEERRQKQKIEDRRSSNVHIEDKRRPTPQSDDRRRPVPIDDRRRKDDDDDRHKSRRRDEDEERYRRAEEERRWRETREDEERRRRREDDRKRDDHRYDDHRYDDHRGRR